jgi:hypothetical protein
VIEIPRGCGLIENHDRLGILAIRVYEQTAFQQRYLDCLEVVWRNLIKINIGIPRNDNSSSISASTWRRSAMPLT